MKASKRVVPVLMYATRLILIVALTAFWLHAGVGRVAACSCISLTPAEAFERADSVFAGEVTETKVRSGLFGQSGLDPRYCAGAGRRGLEGPQQATLTIETVRSEASCGFEFAEGGEYLIFARDGKTGLCDRTALIGRASEDLAALGASWQPTTGTDSTRASSGPWGGVCGAAQGAGDPPLDFTALALLIGLARLGHTTPASLYNTRANRS